MIWNKYPMWSQVLSRKPKQRTAQKFNSFFFYFILWWHVLVGEGLVLLTEWVTPSLKEGRSCFCTTFTHHLVRCCNGSMGPSRILDRQPIRNQVMDNICNFLYFQLFLVSCYYENYLVRNHLLWLHQERNTEDHIETCTPSYIYS